MRLVVLSPNLFTSSLWIMASWKLRISAVLFRTGVVFWRPSGLYPPSPPAAKRNGSALSVQNLPRKCGECPGILCCVAWNVSFVPWDVRSKPCNVEIRGIHGGLPPRGRAKAVQTFGKKTGSSTGKHTGKHENEQKIKHKRTFFLDLRQCFEIIILYLQKLYKLHIKSEKILQRHNLQTKN